MNDCQHRRSSLTGQGLLRNCSSSSNDLTALGAGGFDYDFFSSPLDAGVLRTHNLSSSTPSTSTSTSTSTGLSSPTVAGEDNQSSFIMKIISDTRRWNIGRISVAMLVIFTATDFLLHAAGIHIRPTLGVVSIKDKGAHSIVHDRPELSLGAAAISSITETLGPILPFTGGLDLRREDYWKNGIVGSITSVISQVRDAFSKPSTPSGLHDEESFSSNSNSSILIEGQRPNIDIKHAFAMSSKDPFVCKEKIASLSLADMALIYRYAVESTRPSFDGKKFLKDVEPRLRDVLSAFDKATAASRGAQIIPATTSGSGQRAGDIDALNFCAATRILAEWRVIRQVPEGYKGYAVGMNLGHKDVVQNLAKIEKAIHALIDERTITHSSSSFRAPTLYELLAHEIDANIQDVAKLPRLQEVTAGMGLLWVRRQLQYQNELFTKFLQVGTTYETTNAALNAAYTEVYGKFHGWAVQKIFSYSFQAAPDVVEIFKIMNPHKLEEVVKGQPFVDQAPSAQDEREISHSNRATKSKNVFANIAGFFGDRFGRKHKRATKAASVASAAAASTRGGSTEGISGLPSDEYIAAAMTDDARRAMQIYLTATEPILGSLERLFRDLNMNDPTKV